MSEPQGHVAILGAGPVGLEAALAAAEAGLSFTIYESGLGVAESMREWGHVRLFTPWSLNVSPRMARELAAAGVEVPDLASPDCPTAAELVERVLQPIAELPRIAPHLRLGVQVREVGREGLLKHEEIASDKRRDRRFRILLENRDGEEWVEHATSVLDCTGTWGHPNTLGDGGIAAPGERNADGAVSRTIPDIEGESRSWAGKRVLVVGGGHSAETAIVALAKLARSEPETEVFWARRAEIPTWKIDPDDPLPERSSLVAAAKELCEDQASAVTVIPGVVVEALEPLDGSWRVILRSTKGTKSPLVVDRILSLTGFVPDNTLYRQLQVHECYATSGPMKLAAALLGSAGGDCMAQESQGAESLVNPEPNFFIVGSKSYGRNNTFLMRLGWEQVGEVFSLLASR